MENQSIKSITASTSQEQQCHHQQYQTQLHDAPFEQQQGALVQQSQQARVEQSPFVPQAPVSQSRTQSQPAPPHLQPLAFDPTHASSSAPTTTHVAKRRKTMGID